MFRWTAFILAMGLICPATAALSKAPLPTPNPMRVSAPDPQGAIARFVRGEDTFDTGAVAYAPANATQFAPLSNTQSSLYMVGKLSDAGEPIGDGLIWRVFRDYPDASGQLPLVHKGRGGDLELRLPEGRYIVHAAYGRAAVSKVVELTGSTTSDALVLNAGGLMLDAILDDHNAGRAATEASFEVFANESTGRRLVGTVTRGSIARLPAGSYHVVSKYGDVNAVRTADVVVEPGKLTRVSLRHQAGSISLKLVRREGGEAIADTAWTVFTDDGRAIYERVGAHASVTLAAGKYAVVAKHREDEFSRTFTVESGAESEVIVLAQRLVAPL
ncbi:MAG: hypothetical protein AAGJ94_02945 [Pseudomonadota bacterium]